MQKGCTGFYVRLIFTITGKTWMKFHDLKGTPICISEHDIQTIKTERELILVLDELNR